MPADEHDPQSSSESLEEPQATDIALEEGEEEAAPRRLSQSVDITSVGPCKKHVKVTIPREDIEAQFDKAFSELVETAMVPGFRPGRAPRRLIEKRYRKEMADQVKASLLMSSLEQLEEDHHLVPISQPDIDPLKIELPDEGALEYEFDVEVEPEFELPDYKGLKIKRPVRAITDADVDRHLERLLGRHGQLVPKDAAAEVGDYIAAEIAIHDGDEVVHKFDEMVLRIQPELRFRDATVKQFGSKLKGVKAGQSRKAPIEVSAEAGNPALRGRKLQAVIDVKEVKRLRVPELNPAMLDQLGYASADELREGIRKALERRLQYEQRRAAREQVLAQLAKSTQWELPEDLLRRQAQSALRRRVLELRQAGFTEAEIRARQSELWQNSLSATTQSLVEHFLLSRVADQEKSEVAPADIEQEIYWIAAQSDETPRRVRARLEKEGLLDDLMTQIRERKALDRILEYAEYEDVPLEEEEPAVEAVDELATGEEPVPSEEEAAATEPGGEGRS